MSDTERTALRLALDGRLVPILDSLRVWCIHATPEEVRCELFDAILTAIDRQRPSNIVLPTWAETPSPRNRTIDLPAPPAPETFVLEHEVA